MPDFVLLNMDSLSSYLYQLYPLSLQFEDVFLQSSLTHL